MKQKILCSYLFVTLIAFFNISSVTAGEVFNNPTIGFSIEKPEGWSYLSSQQISENRKNVRMNDKELQEAVQKYASAPLVAMARYPEPYNDLNPSIQVIFRPLGKLQGTAATDILKLVMPAIQRAVTDFQYLDDIQSINVSGLDAAFMRAKYKISNQKGRTFNVLTRVLLIPRGAYMFMISMACKADDPDDSEKIFLSTLDTIKIEK